MAFDKKKEQPKVAVKPAPNLKSNESCMKPQDSSKKDSCCGQKK